MAVTKNSFEGGMNQDKDERTLLNNEYSYALNIRNGATEDGGLGVITGVKGNTEVSFTLPTGANKTIGSYSDNEKERVFYFVWNSEDDHSILEYSVKDESVSKVMQTSELNFDIDFLITGVAVIYDDDNGDLLYFTDNNDEPKVVNVDAGKRTFDGTTYQGLWSAGSFNEGEVVYFEINSFNYFYRVTAASTSNSPYTTTTDPTPNTDWEFSPIGYVYPDTIEEEDLALMPAAPQFINEPIYTTNWDENKNYLRGKMWQFKYKWVYSDNRESAWSPISRVPLPDENVSPFSSETTQALPQKNNQLAVFLNKNSDSLVKKIKVAARYGGSDLAPSDFFLIEEIDVYDLSRAVETGAFLNGFVRVYFKNDRTFAPIELRDSTNLFSWCPKKAKALSLISGNVIALGNIEEGINLDSRGIIESPPTVEQVVKPYPSLTTISATGYSSIDTTFTFDLSTVTTTEGDIVEVIIPCRYRDTFVNETKKIFIIQESYVVQAGDTATDVANAVASLLNLNSTAYIGDSSELGYGGAWVGESFITSSNAGTTVTVASGSFSAGLSTIQLQFIDLIRNSETLTPEVTYGGQGLAVSSFKRNHTHKLGFVYYDKFGRVSTVLTHPNLEFSVPPFSSTSRGAVDVKVNINHLPPSDAERWGMVATRNTPNGVFVCTSNGNSTVTPFDSQYFDVTGGSGVDFVKISIAALNGDEPTAFNTAFESSVLNYSFTKGDRVRFISNRAASTYYTDDLEIYDYDDTVGAIVIRKDELGTTLFNLFDSGNENGSSDANVAGLLMELYTPALTNEDDLFYEIGESQPITGGFHVGNRQTQTGSVSAIQYVDSGDVYFKPRGYVYDARPVSGLIDTYYVEDKNFSDFYASEFTDIGRPNLVSKAESTEERKSGLIGNSRRISVIRYSQPFVPETNINGTGTFYDLDFKEYDKNFQSIQYLHSEGDRMIVMQEDRIGFSYINRRIYQSLQGSTTVAASPEVLSDVTYYAQEYGISTQPEGFAVNGGRKYFPDVNRGVICRLSQDGITPISFDGMDGYLKGVFNNMFISPEKDICLGSYDKRFDEYVVNLKWNVNVSASAGALVDEGGDLLSYTFASGVDVNSLVVGQLLPVTESGTTFNLPITAISGQEVTFDCLKAATKTRLTTSATGIMFNVKISVTLAYSERLKSWSTFYSYIPEWIEASALDLVTFVGGHIYTHNSNSTLNQFYGTDYNGFIEVVCNDNPTMIKFFKAIGLYSGDNVWQTDDDNITTSLSQVSDLLKADFQNKEGHYYSNFLRDKNTGDVSKGLVLSGDKLRGSWLKIRLKADSALTSNFKLFGVEFNWHPSNYTK